WCSLTAEAGRIASIGNRDWAHNASIFLKVGLRHQAHIDLARTEKCHLLGECWRVHELQIDAIGPRKMHSMGEEDIHVAEARAIRGLGGCRLASCRSPNP